MRRIIFFSLLASLLFAPGCKLFKKTTKEDPKVRLLRETVTRTQQSNLDFKNAYISGRAKLEMPEGEMSNLSVTYRIAIDKDKAIMVSIRKIIEAVRVYIDTDSIYFVNKLQREYMVIPTTESQRLLGFQADFGILEDVLLGNLNLFGMQLSALTPVDIEGNPVVLQGKFQSAKLTYKLDKLIHKLVSLNIQDSSQNAEASLAYSSFSDLGGVQVPNNLKIVVSSPQEASADFDHRKIELNQKDFKISFEIPDGYERVDY